MVQILPAGTPKRTFMQTLGLGVGKGLEKGLEQATDLYLQKQKQKQFSEALRGVEDVYADPNLTEQQKLIKAYMPSAVLN
jgi:hypothetical protein